jgi:hypothetical protein
VCVPASRRHTQVALETSRGRLPFGGQQSAESVLISDLPASHRTTTGQGQLPVGCQQSAELSALASSPTPSAPQLGSSAGGPAAGVPCGVDVIHLGELCIIEPNEAASQAS